MAHAVIDVYKGRLTLEVGDENLLIKVFEQDEIEDGEIVDEDYTHYFNVDEFFEDEEETFAELQQKKLKQWEFGERPQGREPRF